MREYRSGEVPGISSENPDFAQVVVGRRALSMGFLHLVIL